MVSTPGGGQNVEVRVSSTGTDETAGKLASIGAAAESMGAKVKMAAGAAGAGLAAMAAGGLAKSVTAFADFDQQLTKSTAIMGDVSGQMKDKLGQTARDVAGDLGISADKAAESYYFLASAGLDAAESMEAMPTVAEFAAAGQMDMAQATDYATDVMKAFQIPTKNMARVTDSMTAAVTRHNQTMEGMGTAMSYVAPVAKGLGMSVEETSAAIGFLGDAGIKGSKAGTTLRQALNKLSNPTKKMQSKLAELGVKVKGSGGKMRDFSAILGDLKSAGANTADIMALFGARAGPGMQVLLNEGGQAIKREAKKIKQLGGITEEVAKKQLDTLNKQWDILVSKLQNVAITIGGTLAPALSGLLKWLSAGVDRFAKINDATDGLAGAATLLTTLVGGLTTALWAFVGGPITLVPALITGLVAVFSGKLPQILSTADRVFGRLPKLIQQAVRSLVPKIKTGLTTAARRGARAFAMLKKWLPPRVRKAVVMAVSWIRGKGAVLAQQAFDWLVQQATAAFGFLDQQIVPAISAALTAAFAWVRTTGASLAQQAFDLLFYNAEVAFNWLSTTGLRLVKQNLTAIWNWVKTTGASLAKSALDLLFFNASAAFDWFVTHGLPAVRTGLTAVWNWVKTTGLSLAKQALSLLARGAVAAFKFGKNNLLPVVQSAVRFAWRWVRTSGVTLAKQALGALGRLAVRAFKFGKQNLLPKVRGAVRFAWRWVKTSGVSLATTALKTLGRLAVRAFKFGKNNLLPKIKGALRSAWRWVKTSGVTLAKGALRVLSRKGKQAFKFTKQDLLPKIRGGLRGAWQWVRGPGVSAAKGAFRFLSNQGQKALKFAKKDLVPKIRTGIRGMNQWTRSTGVPMMRRAFTTLATRSSTALSKLKLKQKVNTAVSKAVTWVKNRGLAMFKGAFRSIGPNLGNAVTGWINIVRSTFKNGIPKIRNWLRNNGANIIKGGFKAIGRGIRSTVLTMLGIAGMVGQAVKSTITGIGNWLKSGGATRLKNSFKSIISGIVSYIKNDAWGDIKGAFEFLWDGAMAAAEGFYEGLIGNSLIPDMLNDIASFIRNFNLFAAADALLKSVWKRFDKFATDAFNVVKNGVGAIAQWLRNGAGNLAGAAKSAAKAAAEALKKAFNNALPDKIKVPKLKVGGGKIPGTNKKLPSASIGGQSLNVPKLAAGGVATGPTLAMIGEGRESEAVLPLSKLDAMLSPQPTASGVDERKLSRAMAKAVAKELGGARVELDTNDEELEGRIMDGARIVFDDGIDELQRETEARRTR